MKSICTVNLNAPDYWRLVRTEAPDYRYQKTTALQAVKLIEKSMTEQGLTVTKETNERGIMTITGERI